VPIGNLPFIERAFPVVDRLVIVTDVIIVVIFRNEQRLADLTVNTVAIEQPVCGARIQPRDNDQITTDTL
jgi:hypothetical protein